MDRLIYTALSGASQTLYEQQISANNLANVNTNGFRADMAMATNDKVKGGGFDTRYMAQEGASGVNDSTGVAEKTERPLDVAIQGAGYIAVQDKNGNEVYTRNGNIQQDDQGQLTIDGNLVLGDNGPIILPPNAIASFGSDGTLSDILMGCSRQYIYKLVAIGKLKASRISNRMAFIRRADIEQMLEGNPYHRILPGNTSTPRKSSSSSLPAKREKREKESEEVLDFYSGEEVMSLFKVKQSWLYTSAKRNHIPICRIAGKNYYSKKHIDEFFGVAVDISEITDWLLTEEVEELFGMKPTALRAYTYRHKIPTKREYGRTYYSKSHLNELRRTDLVNDERYYTVEQVQQIYGLSSANICHIVKVKHIEKIKVGVKNLLLRSDVERVMAERNK